MIWQNGVLSVVMIDTLEAQREVILNRCVFKETSADPNNWSKDNPAHGNCAVIAMIIYEFYGGEILRSSLKGISGYEQMGSHYWNRLPGGVEVDLSAEQFKNGVRDLLPNGEVRTMEYLLSNADTKRRFEIAQERFWACMRLLDIWRGNFRKDL